MLSDFKPKLRFSRQISRKVPNIKFHENPSSRSCVVAYGRKKEHESTHRRYSRLRE